MVDVCAERAFVFVGMLDRVDKQLYIFVVVQATGHGLVRFNVPIDPSIVGVRGCFCYIIEDVFG